MKKILLFLIILAVGVGGYIISQLDFTSSEQPSEEKTVSLSEDDAQKLALAEVDGTITSTTFHDDEKPYYEFTMDTEFGEVVVQVDVGTKFVTTFTDSVTNDSDQVENDTTKSTASTEQSNTTVTSSEQSENSSSEETYKVELPLTKQAAIEAAQQQFDGELEQIITVENGNNFTYEVHLKNGNQNATIIVNKNTGEIDNIDLSKNTISTKKNSESTKDDTSTVNENISNSNSNSTLTKPTAPTPPSINDED